MPRVHGIDIVPRRGRGRARSRPGGGFGVGRATVNNNVATTSSNNYVGETPTKDKHQQNDTDIHNNKVEDINGDTLNISINDKVDNGVATESKGDDEDNNMKVASESTNELPLPKSTEQQTNKPQADNTSIPQTSNSITAASTSNNTTIHIRPQNKECLNQLQFNTTSFSVQDIIHKKSVPNTTTDNNMSSNLSSFIGLGPSLQKRGEDEMSSDLPAKDDKEEEVRESIAKEEADKDKEEDNQTPPELLAQQSTETSTNNPIVLNDNYSNAQWLYNRCIKATKTMEMKTKTPLTLSIQTLSAIHSTYTTTSTTTNAEEDENDDDDTIDNTKKNEILQTKLFELMNESSKRDIDYVFEIVDKVDELLEDTTLTEDSLKEVATAAAVITTSIEVADGGEKGNKGDEEKSLATQPEVEKALHEPQQQERVVGEQQKQATSNPGLAGSPRKMHRSRRKKRPTTNKNTTEEQQATNVEEEVQAGKDYTAGNKAPPQADFPIAKDNDVDMQDDDKWSFLPAEELQSIKEKMLDDQSSSPQRVTRSRGLPEKEKEKVANGVAGENDNKEDEEVKKDDTSEEEKAETATKKKIDEDDHKDIPLKTDSPKETAKPKTSRRGRRSNKKSNLETPLCSEESPFDNKEVYTKVKTRKRSEGGKETVRLMFTGFTATQKHMQMIETIGAEYIESVEDAHMATHVIVSDGVVKLRRTPKLMICICRTSQILSIEWLEQSAASQRVLDTDGYLLLNDREAEKRYEFSMEETIRNGILARKKRGGVLGGWSVYICSGVAGNRAPTMKELHLIIEAAGGHVLKSLSKANTFNPLKTIILTSDPSTKSQLKERGVSKVESAGGKVLPTGWLFQTIISQRHEFDIDTEEDENDEEVNDGSHVSRLVRCDSHESLESTISVLSASPRGKNLGTKRGSTQIETSANNHDDVSVRSSSTRGSRVTHLERAPPPPSSVKRRKLTNSANSKPPPSIEEGSKFSREQFLFSYQRMLSSDELIDESVNTAAAQTQGLWLDYFNTQAGSKSSKKRGRKRSMSPLVTSTTPNSTNNTAKKAADNVKASRSATARNQTIEDNQFITWEAYVLFELGARAEKLESHQSLLTDKMMPTSSFFPCPVSISNEAPSFVSNNKFLSLNISAGSNSFEIFGTLKDVFSLHQSSQTGMIPENIVATLSLQAIEVVAAMHSCGVVHNDISLDSFLVVRKAQSTTGKKKTRRKQSEDDQWFLQLTGFGYKAVVLNQQQGHESHTDEYDHDYKSLASVIHKLLTGGIEITLKSTSHGSVEFASKSFINGNAFLKGASSWCSLIDSLLCAGEVSSTPSSDGPFRLQHPILNIEASNKEGNSRMYQFNGSVQSLLNLTQMNDDCYIDELCKYNSRFIQPAINISTFVYTSHDDRQSFTCSSTNVSDEQKESRIQADILALAHRESELQQKIAQFEKSKNEQESMLKRENDIRQKESELLERERALALEVQKLGKMKEELVLRERKLQERELEQQQKKPPSLHATNNGQTRTASSQLPPQDHLKDSKVNDKCQTLAKESGRKRKRPPTPKSQLMVAAERASQDDNMMKQPSIDHSSRFKNETEEESTLHTPSNKGRMDDDDDDADLSPDLLDDSDDEDDDNNLETQAWESQESTNSSRKRRKGSARKSHHVDSLQSLPKSPIKEKPAAKDKPNTKGNKVFINLGED